MEKVIDFLKKNWLYPLGIVVGAIGGYIYYSQVGCLTGNCPLQSSPTTMMVWGGVIGMFVFSLFKRK